MTENGRRSPLRAPRGLGRRALLGGAAAGAVGLAGAALLGCSEQKATPTPTVATRDPGGQPAAERNAAGLYHGPLPATALERAPAAALRGGTLRMRYLEPPHLDINRTLSCATCHPLSYTLSRLTRPRLGADADPYAVQIEPDLARSWQVSPDATQYVFTLRRGVITHLRAPVNGREFTAEDVRLSLARYQASGTQRDIFAQVTAVAAPDPYTVTVSLQGPSAEFAASIAAWTYLYPRELVENDSLLGRDVVGTGPFVLSTWSRGERAVFRRHPGYFEAGRPYVDEVVVSVEDDRARAQARFLAGEIYDVEAATEAELRDLVAKGGESALGFVFPRSRGANVNGWHFQLATPALQDVRVRRAISLAFDRDAFDRERNGGDNASPEGAFSNAPLPWPFVFDRYPTGKANGEWYRYDPRRASQLLQAAGYSAAQPLQFELVSYYFPDAFPATVIAGINRVPEVKIRYRSVAQETYTGLLANREFQGAIGFVWGPPALAADQWIYPWWHSRGSLNYNNIADAQLDDLLERHRATVEVAARRELLRAIWDRVHDQAYSVWWPEPYMRGAQRNFVMNMRWHGLVGSYLCFASDQARAVWLDGAPAAAPALPGTSATPAASGTPARQ